MSTTDRLLREDLRDFSGYRSARSDKAMGSVWLNANEAPWPSAVDASGELRRYPQPQPEALQSALCALYGVLPEQLLIGRGSDEGIDLLLRTFCTPGQGSVVVAPPVFGMYAICARLQGARIVEVPLVDDVDGLVADLDAIGDAALASGASLVFLCSPGNPSGEALAVEAIGVIARRLEGKAVVVVDEAYGEYSAQRSVIDLLETHDNLAVLRTLSKAHALAAARIGCVIAAPELIAALRRCQAPYPVPQPCAALALAALQTDALARTRVRVDELRGLREGLRTALQQIPGVRRVYPSQGNFLLLRLDDVDAALARLSSAGIVVRDMRAMPQLEDAVRISVGTPQQNRCVIEALAAKIEDAA